MPETREQTIPLPPDDYMALVCGAMDPAELHHWFPLIGSEMADLLEQQGMLGDAVRLLDIGCGCGRVARYLVDRKLASYVGFDRHPGMIGWCTAQIAGRFARFEFKCFAVESAYDGWDGQQGDIPAARFKFPFPDCAFDSVLLASVFTHMPLVEIRNYLAETHRVLSPSGAVLLSVFFSDSGSETVTTM
jgi:SAM-dependent methyltransferase